MAPGLYLRPGNSRSHEEMMGTHHGLSLSDLTIYPHPFLPVWCNYVPPWRPITSPENPKPSKKVRRTLPSTEGSTVLGDDGDGGSGGNGASSLKQLSSLRRLQFRDHICSYKQLMAAGAVEDATDEIDCLNSYKDMNGEEGADGMRLLQLLIHCAEAVACRDGSQASILLAKLECEAVVFGTSFQRVASCFVQGLADRLALVQPLGTVKVVPPVIGAAPPEKEEALRLAYKVCPYLQFGHFVANSSILEALEGEYLVHIVDLGMTLGLSKGYQWRCLMHSLAKRHSGPPRLLRITGVGDSDSLQAIGNDLIVYSKEVGINLEFQTVKKNLESLSSNDFKLVDGEVLVVNSILQLHCVVKESRGALNSVLQTIHGLSPKVLVLVEQDSSHNGPFFLGRFMEALHYYSAIFDSLDAMLPKYDTKRAKVEQFYFAEEIKNIVSFEGPARYERHERLDQWRRRMSRAGFQPAPMKMLAQAKQWLKEVTVCEGYTIAEEKGCLVLGWKSKPIVAASCWKC